MYLEWFLITECNNWDYICADLPWYRFHVICLYLAFIYHLPKEAALNVENYICRITSFPPFPLFFLPKEQNTPEDTPKYCRVLLLILKNDILYSLSLNY